MSKQFRLLVCGSRDFDDEAYLSHVLDLILVQKPGLVIVEGCARGADRMAERYGQRNDLYIEHYPADWNTHGRKAGFLRNTQMADTRPDAVIAFYRNPSQPSVGTQMMVRIARERGIPVAIPAHPAHPTMKL